MIFFFFYLLFFIIINLKLYIYIYYFITYKEHNKKNILGLCLSGGNGGIELYFINLINYFKNSNTNIYSIFKNNSLISDNIKVKKKIFIYKKINIFNILYYAYKISLFVTKNNINTIHIGWTNDLLLAVLIKKMCIQNIKIIYFRQMKITRFKTNIYHKFLYNNVDKILLITEKLKLQTQKFIPYFNKKNLKVLKYGVKKQTKISDINTIIKHFNKNTFNIGIFSRIEEQKGQHLVIQAINDLYLEKGNFFNLYIVGHIQNTIYYNKLKNLVKEYKLTNNIYFIEFIKDPIKIMEYFDLIILPTYEETFGLVIIEAMLMNTSIIGSNAGGVPEIITDKYNGLLFEPKNYKSLKKQINFLLENPMLKDKMIKNAYNFVLKNYDYKYHFDTLNLLFNI